MWYSLTQDMPSGLGWTWHCPQLQVFCPRVTRRGSLSARCWRTSNTWGLRRKRRYLLPTQPPIIRKETMKKTFNELLMLVMVLALGLTACANQPTIAADNATPVTVSSNDVIAEGHLKPVHAANLVFQAPGVVEEINVQVGDTVSKGDVLARLSNADQAQAQLAAANLQRVEAQQALDTLNRTRGANLSAAWSAYMEAQEARAEAERDWEDLDVENVDDRIDDAKVDVEDREADLQDAQDEFDKYKDLDEENSRRKTAEDDLERSEEHTSELQSQSNLVCRLLLER